MHGFTWYEASSDQPRQLSSRDLRRCLADGQAVTIEELVARLLQRGIPIPGHAQVALGAWAAAHDDVHVQRDGRILSVLAVLGGRLLTTAWPQVTGILSGPDVIPFLRCYRGWSRIPVSSGVARGFAEVVGGGAGPIVLPVGVLPTLPAGLLGMAAGPEGISLTAVRHRQVTGHRLVCGLTRLHRQAVADGVDPDHLLDDLPGLTDLVLTMLAADRQVSGRPIPPIGGMLQAVRVKRQTAA